MSYCYMISPILSYKVCSSVSSLFPVCNCGLILYRKKEVMTRIINKLIRVFSGLLKTFGLETASEFGNTTALFALLKTWGKSAQLANAQTMHFCSITQSDEPLSITINSSRVFQTGAFTSQSILHFLFIRSEWRTARRALARAGRFFPLFWQWYKVRQ